MGIDERGASLRQSATRRTTASLRAARALETTTFVAGLISTGMIAPRVLDGPMNGDAFMPYVTRVLVPELSPGNLVIMDNLSSHKAPAARAAIQAACSFRFAARTSTRYRDGLLQAEAHLRKAAEHTIHGLWDAIGRIVDLHSPQERSNYFAAAGSDAVRNRSRAVFD